LVSIPHRTPKPWATTETENDASDSQLSLT
jgi:hypothetical protein